MVDEDDVDVDVDAEGYSSCMSYAPESASAGTVVTNGAELMI